MDKRIDQEDQKVVEALRCAGVHVASSQDLMNTRAPYPQAVPVLIEILGQMETYAIRETIVRSLAVKEAKGRAEESLITEFERSLHDESVDAQTFRWAIANTLDIIGGKGDADSLMRLLLDPRSARSRGLLSVAAAKTKDRRVIPILLDYLNEGDLQGFSARGLGLLRAQEATPRLRKIADETKNSWIRREALKALKRIENGNAS
jgi:HEAT repeat protein